MPGRDRRGNQSDKRFSPAPSDYAGTDPLDRRKQTLLRAIVVTYIQRAEPVGSQFLAEIDGLSVRSATIRNELAEMTNLGLLRQPHTSAGRIPSDLGYRYYVDHLMVWDRLAPADARSFRGHLKLDEGDLDQLLQQTCRMLSSLTGYTSVAAPPASVEPLIRQIHLAQLAPDRVLAVVVLDNGQVTHRFCELPRKLSPVQVTQLSNLLDHSLHDVSISQVAARSGWTLDEHELENRLESIGEGLEESFRVVLAVIARSVQSETGDLLVDGASRMLDQPEFRETDRLEPLVRFLEERRTAYEALRQLVAERQFAVSIGHENPHEAMHDVSLIAARYQAGQRTTGWVGVLGPTRMHYEQAVPAVRYAAQVLSEALSRFNG